MTKNLIIAALAALLAVTGALAFVGAQQANTVPVRVDIHAVPADGLVNIRVGSGQWISAIPPHGASEYRSSFKVHVPADPGPTATPAPTPAPTPTPTATPTALDEANAAFQEALLTADEICLDGFATVACKEAWVVVEEIGVTIATLRHYASDRARRVAIASAENALASARESAEHARRAAAAPSAAPSATPTPTPTATPTPAPSRGDHPEEG